MRWVVVALLLGALGASAEGARLVLRWKEVPGAARYRVEISSDPGFQSVVAFDEVQTPSFAWEALPQATHWWRVRSIDAQGRPGVWSQPKALAATVAAPQPVAPAANATVPCGGPVRFAFEGSKVVKQWLLEVATDERFGSGLRTARAAEPEVRLDLPVGSYFWRATTIDVRGQASEVSERRALHVRLGVPALKPVNDATFGESVVGLGFSEVACAQGYVVEARVEQGPPVRFDAPGPLLAFKPNSLGEVRWRAAAVDAAGQEGDWSVEGLFRVKLAAPVARSEQVRDGVAELAFSTVPGAKGYLVLLAFDKAPARTLTVAGSPAKVPLPEGAAAWRVAAKDELGKPGFFSAQRTVDVTRHRRAPLVVLSPQPGERVGPVLEVKVQGQDVAVGLDDQAPLPMVGLAHRFEGLAPGAHRLFVSDGHDTLEVPFDVVAPVAAPPPTWVRLVLPESGLSAREPRRLVVELEPPREVVVRARFGTASPVGPGEGRRFVDYQPPPRAPDGPERLQVCTDSSCSVVLAEVETPLVSPQVPWSFKASFGGRFNGGGVRSPLGLLALGVRPLGIADWVELELRVQLFGAQASVPLGDGAAVEASAVVVPLGLSVGVGHALGAWRLRALVGVVNEFASVVVAGRGQPATTQGLEVHATVARTLGPGRLELELSYLAAALATSDARLHSGGLGLALGYRLPLGNSPP